MGPFTRNRAGPLREIVQLAQTERSLADATNAFRSRLLDLQTFDTVHNIVGAVYPTLPVLDREATVRAALADRAQLLEDIRARMRRDGYLP